MAKRQPAIRTRGLTRRDRLALGKWAEAEESKGNLEGVHGIFDELVNNAADDEADLRGRKLLMRYDMMPEEMKDPALRRLAARVRDAIVDGKSLSAKNDAADALRAGLDARGARCP